MSEADEKFIFHATTIFMTKAYSEFFWQLTYEVENPPQWGAYVVITPQKIQYLIFYINIALNI